MVWSGAPVVQAAALYAIRRIALPSSLHPKLIDVVAIIEACNYVLTVSRRWSQPQRTQALQAMFLAATADGEMGPLQIKTLAKMREILEMTDGEYAAAIEEALAWESA